jgi:2-C-methyl-D-erythritol 4-phosphate cytidylyltransferase/2-C-methyl-D-erythritol 2,4-cyclodiphosphate synthase
MIVAAVIAAGGSGTRMNVGIPKQFLEIAGKPILLHTVETIAAIEAVRQVIVALPSEHIAAASALFQNHHLPAEIKFVAGGSNRQESVHAGVLNVDPDIDIIMVHDAVRALCGRDLILRVLDVALKKGGAVPGIPAVDTIQRVSREGRIRVTPPREELYAIQTPQAFHSEILRSALLRAKEEGFLGTDESSVVRWAGHPVYIAQGSSENLKITTPLDLKIAEMLISKRSGAAEAKMSGTKLRVGHGIDYHRLIEGRKLILGGVEIPFEKGLEGHSDADVLAHAICDALLGAAALGDIGQHFPDTDPANRGRSSIEFLTEVRKKVEAAGYAIQNVDATLLVQRPRIAPYNATMRTNMANSLGLEISEVNIKATTTEGLNAEGKGEGISAHAITLLVKKD